ncbi:hypothetical protein OROMI_017008 [Orobanche minor]
MGIYLARTFFLPVGIFSANLHVFVVDWYSHLCGVSAC